MSSREKDLENVHITDNTYFMGLIHLEDGNILEALKSFTKYLRQSQAKLGWYHPHVAIVLNNIGELYFDQHYYQKALHFFRCSLQVREYVCGEGHVDIFNNLCSIGECLQKMGEERNAVIVYKKALQNKHTLPGKIDIEAICIMYIIIRIYNNLGDLDNSLEMCRTILRAEMSQNEHRHVLVSRTINIIGTIYMEKGLVAEAIRAFSHAARICGDVCPMEFDSDAVSLAITQQFLSRQFLCAGAA
mmetsp:Transcript_9123/g.13225  ORF Transcript_9123/g.13225 Transcript_9123/m.13225 type:complete len:245 (+) Transcript_9123:50-784(+)